MSERELSSERGGNSFDHAPAGHSVNARQASMPRSHYPVRRTSDGGLIIGPNAYTRSQEGRAESWERKLNGSNSTSNPPSHAYTPQPPSRERAPSTTANSRFPLNDIDYESSPAAVAQELSNLQALRRMSMDVGGAMDPDLPQLNVAALPRSPSPSSSDDDSSRLFWVPARLHPELAPQEFKSFLESKSEQINRRSGELSAYSNSLSSLSSSLSAEDQYNDGLRRRKSMLSHQIDNSVGYQDGADRLERQRSQSRGSTPSDPNLQELESLVSSTEDLRRLSLETSATEESGDVILPIGPNSSLKRSTRTTYKRGGSLKGKPNDRATYAQRAARKGEGEGGRESPTGATNDVPPVPYFTTGDVTSLAQTLKDPSQPAPTGQPKTTYNFSRPATAGQVPATPTTLTTTSSALNDYAPFQISFDNIFGSNDFGNRLSSASTPEVRRKEVLTIQSTGFPSSERHTIPHIVEVPPPEENVVTRPSTAPGSAPIQPPPRHPQRTSSREDRPKPAAAQRPTMPPKQSSSSVQIQQIQQPQPSQTQAAQRLDQPSPLPGNDNNTSNMAFIPALTVDKRADNKKKEEKKSGWGWLLGKEDSDKEKSEKARSKQSKSPQPHDNTRLDLLQTSIDGSGKGRDSLVLDREGLKLEEERKKESARKSTGSEGKKEKESLFASFFGGKKGKGDKDSSKKYRDRGLSPDPPYRELKPDIDYNWTRFSILEERAIYRMAHMKLANPRRALYSQVLLSNFMYSYLAKVQQMHPQMNLPTSAKQQKKQLSQQKEAQPDEFTQYQRYQQQVSTHANRQCLDDKLTIHLATG